MVIVDGYEVREGLYYHKEHFWARVEEGAVRFGATDYGQKMDHKTRASRI
jgi:glycine cleavage system H lipoate-binding protein